jgi:hypothetical protein
VTAACGSNWTANLLHYLRALPLAKNCVLKIAEHSKWPLWWKIQLVNKGVAYLIFHFIASNLQRLKKIYLQANTAGLA